MMVVSTSPSGSSIPKADEPNCSSLDPGIVDSTNSLTLYKSSNTREKLFFEWFAKQESRKYSCRIK